MFNERRLVNFEELEPRFKKKQKKRSSSLFEYNVEIPKKNIDSMEKAKGLSEHKEIMPLKTKLKAMKEREDKEREKSQDAAKKVLDELSITKCPKCESLNIEENGERNYKCIDCKCEWK